MKKLSFDYSKALGFINEEELALIKSQVEGAEKLLREKQELEMIFWVG